MMSGTEPGAWQKLKWKIQGDLQVLASIDLREVDWRDWRVWLTMLGVAGVGVACAQANLPASPTPGLNPPETTPVPPTHIAPPPTATIVSAAGATDTPFPATCQTSVNQLMVEMADKGGNEWVIPAGNLAEFVPANNPDVWPGIVGDSAVRGQMANYTSGFSSLGLGLTVEGFWSSVQDGVEPVVVKDGQTQMAVDETGQQLFNDGAALGFDSQAGFFLRPGMEFVPVPESPVTGSRVRVQINGCWVEAVTDGNGHTTAILGPAGGEWRMPASPATGTPPAPETLDNVSGILIGESYEGGLIHLGSPVQLGGDLEIGCAAGKCTDDSFFAGERGKTFGLHGTSIGEYLKMDLPHPDGSTITIVGPIFRARDNNDIEFLFMFPIYAARVGDENHNFMEIFFASMASEVGLPYDKAFLNREPTLDTLQTIMPKNHRVKLTIDFEQGEHPDYVDYSIQRAYIGPGYEKLLRKIYEGDSSGIGLGSVLLAVGAYRSER